MLNKYGAHLIYILHGLWYSNKKRKQKEAEYFHQYSLVARGCFKVNMSSS